MPHRKEEVSEPHHPPTEASLGRCLVEGDATAHAGDRRRRQQALGISVVFEAIVVAVLVAAPLVTSVAQMHYAGTSPVPFFFGSHNPVAAQSPPSGNRHSPIADDDHRIKFVTDHISPRPNPVADQGNDTPEGDSTLSLGPGIPGGPVISDFRPLDPPVRPPDETRNPQQKRALNVSESLQQAQLIERIEPRYPVLAVQARKEGTVILHAIINREGRITALEVVSGQPLLVKAAVDAVKQWRYRPTLLNGEAVEVETSITVVFRLSP